MKTRETALMIVGIICVLVFMGVMFEYYTKTRELHIIEKNTYYDSLLVQEQKLLKHKDSLLTAEHLLIVNEIEKLKKTSAILNRKTVDLSDKVEQICR